MQERYAYGLSIDSVRLSQRRGFTPQIVAKENWSDICRRRVQIAADTILTVWYAVSTSLMILKECLSLLKTAHLNYFAFLSVNKLSFVLFLSYHQA